MKPWPAPRRSKRTGATPAAGVALARGAREAGRRHPANRAHAICFEALGDLADRCRAARLGDDVDRAGAQRLDRRRRPALRQRADDDHRHRPVLHQLAQEAQAVHARHLDVERDHVRLEPQDQVARDERIGGAADHFDVRLALQRVGEQLAHDRRVVDDQRPCIGRRDGSPVDASEPSAPVDRPPARSRADRRWRRSGSSRRTWPSAPTRDRVSRERTVCGASVGQPAPAHHVGELAGQVVHRRIGGGELVRLIADERDDQLARERERHAARSDAGERRRRNVTRRTPASVALGTAGASRPATRLDASRRSSPRPRPPTPRSSALATQSAKAVRRVREDISHHLRAERFLRRTSCVQALTSLPARVRAVGRDDDARRRLASLALELAQQLGAGHHRHVDVGEAARRRRVASSRPSASAPLAGLEDLLPSGTSLSCTARRTIWRIVAESSTIRMLSGFIASPTAPPRPRVRSVTSTRPSATDRCTVRASVPPSASP